MGPCAPLPALPPKLVLLGGDPENGPSLPLSPDNPDALPSSSLPHAAIQAPSSQAHLWRPIECPWSTKCAKLEEAEIYWALCRAQRQVCQVLSRILAHIERRGASAYLGSQGAPPCDETIQSRTLSSRV